MLQVLPVSVITCPFLERSFLSRSTSQPIESPSMRALLYSLSLLFLPVMSLCAAPAAHPVVPIQDSETNAQRNARMAWWREARFGMFIHWGLYTVPSGAWQGKTFPNGGEWIMHTAKVPVSEYKALTSQFNPTLFNADEWVGLAKKAGMKYIVITAKHHDGFAMFNSKASSFDIVDATPFKRDILKELAAACQKQGLKLGFYYSQVQDWTAPGGATRHGGHWDKAQDGDFAQYFQTKAIPQMEELLSNYQPFPAVIWFDTPGAEITPQLAGKMVVLLNEHPNLIWNNRLGGGYAGDTETPENHIPPQGFPGQDWETCMTINGTWGYKSSDTKFKSTEILLRNLVDIASKGGNYLLNVGPDQSGVIPQPEADRLLAIGKWLDVNGESIYGTGPTPFGAECGSFSPIEKDPKGQPLWVADWGWRCTIKPGKVFIHLLKWPGDSFVLSNEKNKVTKAYMLADPQQTALQISQSGSDVTVKLPTQAPDSIDSVLVLDIETSPVAKE